MGANRAHYQHLQVLKDQLVLITAELTGAGAADMTNAESADFGGGEVSAATRTGAGKFTLTFRKKYPQLKAGMAPLVVGTTDGLVAQFASIDLSAGTAALETYVGSTPTDPASTDTIYLCLIARNSGRNT